MEKWARNLQLIVNKRDALLQQLNETTGEIYSYSTLKKLSMSDFEHSNTKIIFSQVQKAINEYDDALKERDEKMLSKFLESLIHEKKPTKETRNWWADKY